MLLDSRCLDTMVQFGAYDTGFAIEAGQKILKNPGYYERSDKSDRVYASLDDKGNFISGDARYGALQLLANNPDAARHFYEKAEGANRTEMLKYLEDGGLVGEAAARALEVALHDLTRKESVDTLELALRLTAHGKLHPEGAGKAALARLLSKEELRGDLFASVAQPEGDSNLWFTDAEGWNIPGQTLAKAFASIVDDAKARADLLVGLSDQANSLLKEQARALADADSASFDKAMQEYFVAVGKIGLVFRAVIEGGAEAGKVKKPNAAGVTAIERAISEAAKLLPGGAVVVDAAKAGVNFGKEQLLEHMEKGRLKELDAEGLKSELVDKLKIYAVLNLFSDGRLIARLVPPDSVLRKPDGRVHIPEPPIGGVPNTEWNRFLKDIETTGPPISNVVNDAALRVEAFIR